MKYTLYLTLFLNKILSFSIDNKYSIPTFKLFEKTKTQLLHANG